MRNLIFPLTITDSLKNLRQGLESGGFPILHLKRRH